MILRVCIMVIPLRVTKEKERIPDLRPNEGLVSPVKFSFSFCCFFRFYDKTREVLELLLFGFEELDRNVWLSFSVWIGESLRSFSNDFLHVCFSYFESLSPLEGFEF